MNKAEAKAAAYNGAKITHTSFAPSEYFTIVQKTIATEYGTTQVQRYIFEDGNECTPAQFWHYRTAPTWETGYSIFNPQNPTEWKSTP